MSEKNILGLDLGTTSIGFAHVIENDEDSSKSSIIRLGVRVNPLSTDEQTDFEKGKPISTNAVRTLKRGARRTLDRYQDRRKNLIDVLLKSGFITKDTKLAESKKDSTHSTYANRAKAVTEKIDKDEFAKVLLAINKKRGYKSSRKAKNEDEGQAIDGMAIAKLLYEEGLTPGQLTLDLLKKGKKAIPDFYRSDLKAEFEKVWNSQKIFYPEIFTDEFKLDLEGKGQRATSAIFWTKYNFNIAEFKGSRDEKKINAYEWRARAIKEKLEKEEAAYVITDINNNLNNSSGYLGAISDRSKELYFHKETVGQYLYKQLQESPHTKLKNQVFYRQDYLDEFDAIWTKQTEYHKELTDILKNEIRDIIIFYQRKLKSQKGLVSFCEFENRIKEIKKDGLTIKKMIGLRVAPKSSPLFQEFKIWQNLHNIVLRSKTDKSKRNLEQEEMKVLFNELNLKGNLEAKKILAILGNLSPAEWDINYTAIEGNRTSKALYDAYFKILEEEGYDEDLLKLSDKDEIDVSKVNMSANEIKNMVKTIFKELDIKTEILDFDAQMDGKEFEKQPQYQLWHLLYSYEGDDSPSGNEKLYSLLYEKYGFKKAHAQILANVALQDDFGNLCAKAIRKIYTYIQDLPYDKACLQAGYKHSASSLTKEEIEKRQLKNRLELLKKNSLRNPVVEKILNQVVNVVNTLIETNSKKNASGEIIEYFKFDEIRIELARELKKNAKERKEMTSSINTANINHGKINKILQNEFGIKNPTRNDIIRYKLYEELKTNGFKDLYTNTYIPRELIFSKQIDIEHIIPQSKVFDDSFSNKTITYRKDNLEKGNKTASDFIEGKYGIKGLEEYKNRLELLYEFNKKNKEEGISKAKFQKLLKKEADIGDGFIERDLRDSQYIAKKARNMMYEICRVVTPTTGNVTNRLREDWDLINIMQELNFDKFKKLGLTEMVEKKDGSFKERIVDWSKRNDHRHHAMDALTIAFTKQSHIQYLNFLNARKNEEHREHLNINGIETNETFVEKDYNGNNKRKFKLPIPNFREQAKEHLNNVLISHKAKNKVVTKNKNKIAGKIKPQITLTPRGQLHKEMIYGKYHYYISKEESVTAKMDKVMIDRVSNPIFKKYLLKRLNDNDNDPKKAFSGKNSLSKNPIYLDAGKTKVIPEKIKTTWLEEDFSIRKEINPENFKDEKSIEKIVDLGVKKILLNRLKEYSGDGKAAFSNLDKNPIWLNKDKGISIKRATISGIKNAEALHSKKDHFGNDILDESGNKIPSSFVSTGNNHHVAIYKDDKGNLQEKVISFFEAVERVNQRLPVIDKSYNSHDGWIFQFTMKQNEYFVFPNEQLGFNPYEIDLLDFKNNEKISPNLFRVQKIATKNYFFRHHLETTVEEKKELKNIAYKAQLGLNAINNIVKVRLNHLGVIVKIGE